jgi:hypothetical protein
MRDKLLTIFIAREAAAKEGMEGMEFNFLFKKGAAAKEDDSIFNGLKLG